MSDSSMVRTMYSLKTMEAAVRGQPTPGGELALFTSDFVCLFDLFFAVKHSVLRRYQLRWKSEFGTVQTSRRKTDQAWGGRGEAPQGLCSVPGWVGMVTPQISRPRERFLSACSAKGTGIREDPHPMYSLLPQTATMASRVGCWTGSQKTQVQGQALLLTCCVTLGNKAPTLGLSCTICHEGLDQMLSPTSPFQL